MTTIAAFVHALAMRLDAMELQALQVRTQVSDPEMRAVAGAEAQVYGKLRQCLLGLQVADGQPPAVLRPMATPEREARPPIVTRAGPGDTTLSGFFALMSRRFPELGRSAAPVRFTCDGHPVTLESVAVAEDGVTVNLTGLETGREPWGAS